MEEEEEEQVEERVRSGGGGGGGGAGGAEFRNFVFAFTMNISLAFTGLKARLILISKYGCSHMLFIKLQPIREGSLLLPYPVGSKAKT